VHGNDGGWLVLRTTALSGLLAGCAWFSHASAQPIAITEICTDERGREIKCAPRPPPEVSASARRAYLHALATELKNTPVANLQDGRFKVLKPAEWHADSPGAAEGWCVARSDEYPAEKRRFYHVRIDEKSCRAAKNDATRSATFEPFDAWKNERIVCDSPDSRKCAQAASRFASLAKMNLADAPNVTFDERSIAPNLKSRFASRMQSSLGRADATILVDPLYFPGTADWSPCVGIDPGGVVCGREPAETLIYSSGPKRLLVSSDQPLASGAWRYRVVENAFMRRCSWSDGPSQTFTLFIENDSDERLECTASLTTGRDRHAPATEPVAVEPRERRVAFEACLGGEGVFQGATAACTARAAPPPLASNLPAGCAYAVIQAPGIEEFYPPAARRLGEEGAVDVSFAVTASTGRLTDIEIAKSSGSARLDEGALRYLRNIRARSTCPDVRYPMRVRFRLDDFGGVEEIMRSP
jgi:TonB family protein